MDDKHNNNYFLDLHREHCLPVTAPTLQAWSNYVTVSHYISINYNQPRNISAPQNEVDTLVAIITLEKNKHLKRK